MEVKRAYPYLVVNNKAKLTVYYGQNVTEVYFQDRKAAEMAIMEITAGMGREPVHDIKDI